MLRPTSKSIAPDCQLPPSPSGYFLSEVRLDIPGPDVAEIRAKLNGPAGARVWARAWLSTEADGTLAETASDEQVAGDTVKISVRLKRPIAPEIACIRLESQPLHTEQVVIIKLPK